MKLDQRLKAVDLRKEGYSIKHIANELSVAVSSVSVWVRHILLTPEQLVHLENNSYTTEAIEKRRQARISGEMAKRNRVVLQATKDIQSISQRELWLMGVMLYWAEGGKTQRMVRFSNGDPNMHILMMKFFRKICKVPEQKIRGYIHIHDHLDFKSAEQYWSDVIKVPRSQFFKTYRKLGGELNNKKNTLPNGVLDVYVLDTNLFLKISGWAAGIFRNS